MQNHNNPHEDNQMQAVSSPYNFPRRSTFVTLNVALYPWAAKHHLEQYCQVIEHYWYNVLDKRDVYLNWLPTDEWDGGYKKTPQNHFDVFIYDTQMMDYFHSQRWLSVLDRNEITYAHEIDDNDLSLVEHDHGKYYGIPIYKCIYFLAYHSNDHAIASIKSFEDLLEVASKRLFVMRKPNGSLKLTNYLALLNENDKLNYITKDNINLQTTNRLSHLYKYAKVFLNTGESYSFKNASFYIGYTEDINTILLIDEDDLSNIEFMFVPFNNPERPQCWLDCIGIHPQTKLRGTYETSLQLANLMTCSHVMNECLQGQFYVITANHVTLSYLASKNVIYAKLQTLINNSIFRPSLSLPITVNPSISVQEQWTRAIAIISEKHQEEMQSMVNTSAASS